MYLVQVQAVEQFTYFQFWFVCSLLEKKVRLSWLLDCHLMIWKSGCSFIRYND